jgi:hypothetical protein
MLGYMTIAQAKSYGFTNHGSYFGIPCYICDDSDFMVATKWAPMEYLMTAFHVIEQTLRPMMFPDDPPGFQFKVGSPL